MSFIALCILIVSIIAHEVAHGIAALWQGDETAKNAGRLTLNPIAHIDPIGSILVPFMCALISPGFMFGWAKPVPINPYNFRNHKWGEALVSFAGPLTNIIIALVFTVLIRTMAFGPAFLEFAYTAILINIVLALFNLIPIPPLDGSKILFSVLPRRWYKVKTHIEQRGFFISIIVVLAAWHFFQPLAVLLFRFLIGASI
ncbi:MAG: site-2 protease family protein [Patescibacteria group bacterium]